MSDVEAALAALTAECEQGFAEIREIPRYIDAPGPYSATDEVCATHHVMAFELFRAGWARLHMDGVLCWRRKPQLREYRSPVNPAEDGWWLEARFSIADLPEPVPA